MPIHDVSARHGVVRLVLERLPRQHLVAVTTYPQILLSRSAGPKRCPIAFVAASAASTKRAGPLASISFRKGVPWQYATAGTSKISGTNNRS